MLNGVHRKRIACFGGLLLSRRLLASVLCSSAVLLAVLSLAAPISKSGAETRPVGERIESRFVQSDADGAAGSPNQRLGNWSIVRSPSMPGTNELYAANCVGAPDCWSVGYFNTATLPYQTLTERWEGDAWRIVPSPNRSGHNILYGVTCNSGSDCWAVGTHWETNGSAQRTLIEHWDGNAWRLIDSPNRGLSNPPIDVLAGVTCSSNTNCWAVGGYDDVDGSGRTLVVRWDGSSWTIVDSDNPSGSDSLFSVTCVSPQECWAVGETATGLGMVRTLIEKWDGHVWSTVPSPNPGSDNSLRSVTCPSQFNCWAVGQSNNRTLVEHWGGTSWEIVSSPNTSAEQNLLFGITCPSASGCWSIGYSGSISLYQTLIERWDGASWRVYPSPNVQSSHLNQLTGVSCASESECWTVGYFENSNGIPKTFFANLTRNPPP